MAQAPSIEIPEQVFLLSAKTLLSKLWFVNNKSLEYLIKAHLAKYQEMYGVLVHGFILMGNHYHLLARFPNSNKAAFKQAFHSTIAKLTNSQVKQFEGGTLWGSNRGAEFPCPRDEDVLHWFFYLTLNPIQSGLVQRIGEYPGYNSFYEAVQGIKTTYKLVDREGFEKQRAKGKDVSIKDYTHEYVLSYSRLQGFEDMGKREYVRFMHDELAVRTMKAVEERIAKGKGFLDRASLRSIVPGSVPLESKKRKRGEATRPIVLTLCQETKEQFKAWYFQLLVAYQEASRRYRAGEFDVEFPPGTYRPRLRQVCGSG